MKKEKRTYSFEMVTSKLPYHIDITPVAFNNETRFDVIINGDDGHLFVWDPVINELRPIDDDSATLPDDVQKEISARLVRTLAL